jgi:hypothetical protein
MCGLDVVEGEQVSKVVVVLLRELTLMNSSATEHTQKCYKRHLEPHTPRIDTTYEKFACDLYRKFRGTEQ